MNAQQLIAKVKQYPLAFAGGVLCLVFLLLLYFTSGKVSGLEATYQDVENQLNTILQNNQQSVGLSQDLEEAKKMVAELDDRLMRDDAKADHYQYFLGIAESSGVSIADPVYGGYFNPDEKDVKLDTKEFAQIIYSLEVKGNFESVMDFLYELRTGKYFIRESRVRLSTTTDPTGTFVRAELLVKILSVKKEVEKKAEKK